MTKVLVYTRAKPKICDECGSAIDGVVHEPHDRDCPRVDRPRWCAKSVEGWCAVRPHSEPEEGSWSVKTVCGYGITLPGGYDRREPSCPDCRALLERDCTCANQTCVDCCWDCGQVTT